MIKELHSNFIDKRKWDILVSLDPHHKVYAMSWFLDAITNNDWHCLVLDDYSAVMPFVVKRKYGLSYCYMPMFAQQFSVYGAPEHSGTFVDILRKKYKYAELCFSDTDFIPKDFGFIDQRVKSNYILSLSKDYTDLYGLYSKKHQASLSKYSKERYTYELAEDIKPLLHIFRKEKKEVYSSGQMNQLLNNIEHIYDAARKKGVSRLYQAKDNGEVIGGAFFVLDGQRIYYFFGVSEKNGVSFVILDRLIREYAGSDLTLDFEGSDNPGIAHFFKGFGAMNEPYTVVKWNDLPFWIKWIKN